MIIELELGALLAVEIVRLGQSFFAGRRADASAAPAPVLSPAPAAAPVAAAGGTPHEIEIVRRAADGGWIRVGFRHPNDGDVLEALSHPELAVRHADGTLEGVN